MDLNRKLEMVHTGIQSISTHTDIDAAVRLAALDRVADMVGAERAAIKASVDAEIDASLPKPADAKVTA